MSMPYDVSYADVRPDNRDPSLVAAYDMTQETAGIIKDISGNGYNGTITGNPIQGNGLLGNYLDFKNSEIISLGNVINKTEGSFSTWVYLDRLKNYNTIFDNLVNPDMWELWVYLLLIYTWIEK